MEEEIKKSFRGTKWLWVVAALALLLVIFASAAFYFYFQFYYSGRQNTAREVEKVVQKVGRLMVLPEGEAPTVATVTDPEKLKDQQFFQNAKEGYKVLIYTNAKKAILYDPAQNKIVEVAPLNIGGAPQ